MVLKKYSNVFYSFLKVLSNDRYSILRGKVFSFCNGKLFHPILRLYFGCTFEAVHFYAIEDKIFAPDVDNLSSTKL